MGKVEVELTKEQEDFLDNCVGILGDSRGDILKFCLAKFILTDFKELIMKKLGLDK